MSARHDDCARLLARAGFTDRAAAAQKFGTEEQPVEIPIHHYRVTHRKVTRGNVIRVGDRPAVRLLPLRKRIAALTGDAVAFAPREVGEANSALLNYLVERGELRRVRYGIGGRVRSPRLDPLYKRTARLWHVLRAHHAAHAQSPA